MLVGKQSHPIFVVDHLVKPRAFAQSAHHVSGEAILLQELLVDLIRAEVRQSAWPSPVDVGRCCFLWPTCLKVVVVQIGLLHCLT